MSDQFVAEIRMFAGNFAPTGWASCDGQILPISQNTALFSLLGTTYGGKVRGQASVIAPLVKLLASLP
jgi:microcystin-dependent protein